MASDIRHTELVTIGSGGESIIDSEIFAQYKPCFFAVGGKRFAFPVISIEETGANRLVERERPYRSGAKVDSTGAKAKRWTLEAFFENSIADSGVLEINELRPLYPDVLTLVTTLFDIQATGDLHISTRGMRRVRAESYSRRESAESRDSGVLRLTFIEDNEDNVDASSIAEPSVSANGRRLATTTTFVTQSAGAWHSSLNDLDVFISELETLINAPGDFGQSVRFVADKVRGNVQRARRAFHRSGRAGRDLMLDPTNSRAERKLVQQQEMSARAQNDSRKGRPRLIQIVFRERMSLFRVSVIIDQNINHLFEVNPNLDAFNIPAMTPINVFAEEKLFHDYSST